MKRAVVVAHPDDEVLWAGGLIIRFPGDWTIICCTIPRSDPIRAVKFLEACEVLGATPHVHGETEPYASEHIPFLDDIDLSDYDHIVTHGAEGEYGHIQHKDVHRHVARKYSKKKLTFFGYRPGVILPPIGGFGIHLTEFESARKLKALKKYDHIHPYNNRQIPKWEALMDNYIKNGGLNFNVETYEGEMP